MKKRGRERTVGKSGKRAQEGERGKKEVYREEEEKESKSEKKGNGKWKKIRWKNGNLAS